MNRGASCKVSRLSGRTATVSAPPVGPYDRLSGWFEIEA